MSNSDAFYSHFPSLNSNSKENQRNKRISQEYANYIETLKSNIQDSPKPTKQQQRVRRSRDNVSVSSLSDVSNPSMDIIFSAEDRNRFEDEQKEEKRKVYKLGLQRQIEEQRLKKLKDVERQKREEIILEQRLQRQIESIKLHRDPQAEKIVERVSLSENEKESYHEANVSNHSTSSNNDVYRYFSQSAKVDSDLFNYKKYFKNVSFDRNTSLPDYSNVLKPAKSNQVALTKAEAKSMPKKSEINKCPTCTTHAECSRCHKKLEMFCKECNEEHDKVSPEPINQLQLEYDEPELPFSSEQQVVVYRANDQHAPYSFNIDPNSRFFRDTLDQLRGYNEQKMANYIQLYGDLKKKKLAGKVMKIVDDQPKPTGAIPKRKPLMDKSPEKNFTTTSSDIEDILSNAQYTVITQLGFAKKQLAMEKLKF